MQRSKNYAFRITNLKSFPACDIIRLSARALIGGPSLRGAAGVLLVTRPSIVWVPESVIRATGRRGSDRRDRGGVVMGTCCSGDWSADPGLFRGGDRMFACCCSGWW